MLEHLGNPEYLHTLLNPLPVYGLAVGTFGLVIALLSRSRAARITALSIVFVRTLSAWPVYEKGESAYDRVLPLADSDGVRWLDEHMHRAEKLIYAFYLLASLAAITVTAEFKLPRAAVPLAVVSLLVAVGTIGAGGYIAYAGGRIRHREFRYEPPPPAREDHEH